MIRSDCPADPWSLERNEPPSGARPGRAPRRVAAAAVGAVLLLASACGGGGDGPATATAAASAASSIATLDAGTVVVAEEAARVQTAAAIGTATPVKPDNLLQDLLAALEKLRKAHLRNWLGIVSIAVSPDGGLVAMAHSDGVVRVDDGAAIGTTRWQTGAGQGSTGVAFIDGGRRLVSVGQDSQVHVWQADNGRHLLRLGGHEHPLRSVASSGDGAWVATAGEETRVLLWSAANGRLRQVLTGATDFVNVLAFSPDGRTLAGGTADGRVLLWDITSGALRNSTVGHAGQVFALAFSSDGRFLASGGEDALLALWNMPGGARFDSLAGQHHAAIRSVAFSDDGSRLASAGDEGSVIVWNTVTRQPASVIDADGSAINTLVFSKQRPRTLYVGTQNGRPLVFDVLTGRAQ